VSYSYSYSYSYSFAAVPRGTRIRGDTFARLRKNQPCPMAAEKEATPAWATWLAHAELAPDFQVAPTLAAFERQRAEIRATLWRLLGRLPPRPSMPRALTLSIEETEQCRIERFELDNGA